jgi:hypothetical protein
MINEIKGEKSFEHREGSYTDRTCEQGWIWRWGGWGSSPPYRQKLHRNKGEKEEEEEKKRGKRKKKGGQKKKKKKGNENPRLPFLRPSLRASEVDRADEIHLQLQSRGSVQLCCSCTTRFNAT